MPSAKWNGQVIAQSDTFETVEGNIYFPADSIKKEYFVPSNKHTVCGWKGTASYYSLSIDGKTNVDAAWYYPEPKSGADIIKGMVAFWKGVEITQ